MIVSRVEWGIFLALFGSASFVLASVFWLVETPPIRAAITWAPRARKQKPKRNRKWWLDSVEERPSPAAADLEPLALANQHAAVLVEVAIAGVVYGEVSDDARTDERPRVQRRFLDEAHRRQYGRPWGMGRYIFDFAVDAGLRPEHRLLDFGCGALRLGVWAIPYLEAGNYFGVDSDLLSLEAAATYEVPLHGLAEKRPRLLWNDDFSFSHFGTSFDYIIDFSSSQRVRRARRGRVFASFAEVLSPGGRLLISPRTRIPAEELAGLGLRLVRRDVIQRCELLEGHEDSFRSHAEWNEFVRM